MDAPDEEQRPAARSCPDCGFAVAPGQRRCTNCGASVDVLRKRITRRTPLVVALAVTAVAGGAVVVAQAAVTEKASIDAGAPADVASAPVSVTGAALPAPAKPTSTAPKVEAPPSTPASTTPTLDIPQSSTDLLKAAQEARDKAAKEAKQNKDGQPVDDDTKADPNDLQDPKKVKIVNAYDYDPDARAGVEFGEPKASIDKRSRTVWDVNVPADGQPFGVGIVLDLGDELHRVSTLKIGTPTPKFGVEIYRSDAEKVPDKLDDRWTKAATVPDVSDDVSVPLTDGDGKWARYILVYLTTPRSADDTRAAISNLEVYP
jgi:hypothetical protein